MLTKEEIKKILSSRIIEIDSLKIPHFSLLDGIDKASKRVLRAIKNKEKIVVVGDYDVDGVVSSSIMYKFLNFLNADVEVIIPNRFEDGYGLSVNLAKKIDANLVITVDNGITSFEVIITDHHNPLIDGNLILPNAYSIINPKISQNFPFKEICGAEVAWYFCAAIKNEANIEYDLRDFLDELAIAIIADVMPLTHLNRTLVKMGLKRLNKALKPFSRAIKRFFNREINAEDVAFLIAPRLNSAGRIAHANLAFRFLISEDDEEAYRLFLELDATNIQRREIQEEILQNIKITDDDFLIIKGEYNEGVVGIVASRLVSEYKKPAIVLTKKDGILKGSGRSLGNINIFELINSCNDLLENFGGHKLACGLSLKEENFALLKDRLNELIKKFSEDDFFIEDFVLGELDFREIDEELMKILDEYEPYGEANPKPKFIATVKVLNLEHLKDNHYKLILEQNGKILPAIIFRYEGEFDKIIKIKFTLSRDIYSNIQIMIEEIL
jgi:single-stranded-DNA-specific exonuclease